MTTPHPDPGRPDRDDLGGAGTSPFTTAVPPLDPVRRPHPVPPMPGRRTGGRVWAYLGVVVGAVVSVAANVAHSYVRPPDLPDELSAVAWTPEPGAVIGATFWPIALLITTEIMVRTHWPPGRAWLLLRFLGLLPVAAVAGIVSYLHLHGLLQHYHEAPLTCLIAPLSVDGLMVMASSALVASSRAASQDTTIADTTPIGRPPQAPPVTAAGCSTRFLAGKPTDAPDDRCEACRTRPATVTWSRPTAGHPFRLCRPCTPNRTWHVPDDGTEPEDMSAAVLGVRTAGSRHGRLSTATAVAQLLHHDPSLSTADIADRLGVTTRTVRRHLADHRSATKGSAADTSAPRDTAAPRPPTPSGR